MSYDFVLIYILLIFGSCLQSLVGFGLGLLSAPLVYFIAPELVPGPMILLALLNTSILAYKHRESIDFQQTKMTITGGTLGVTVATLSIGLFKLEQFSLIFGLLILIAVVISLVGPSPRIGKTSSLIASFFSGILGTITSAGGAPMGLLYQKEDQANIKANLSIFFVYINFIAITALFISGHANGEDIIWFLKLFPAILIGYALSFPLSTYISEKYMRYLVLLVATISGVILIN